MYEGNVPIEQAIEYSLNDGDVHVRCNCGSFKFHGFSYMGTQLGYLYGLPRENRYQKTMNPDLENVTCKHVHMALEYLLKNKSQVVKLFSQYYDRLPEVPEDTMIAIPAKEAVATKEPEVAESEETGDIEVSLY